MRGAGTAHVHVPQILIALPLGHHARAKLREVRARDIEPDPRIGALELGEPIPEELSRLHANGNHNKQKSHFKVTSGNTNGSTHGSAKSGSQSFRIK